MHYISSPNLPQNRVRALLISETAGEAVIKEIEKRDIEPIVVHACSDIADPVSSHPDMLFHHLGGNKMLYYKNADKSVIKRLSELGFEMIESSTQLRPDYPYDIALNSVRVGSNLLCLQKYTDKAILDYCVKEKIHIINVRQGYSKCSTCVVDDSSIITADKSIANSAYVCRIDVLTVNPGYINLKGYSEGFIGGCSGKSERNKIIFIGDVTRHQNYSEIKSFLDKREIKIDILGDGELHDVGSIIPLLEE